MNAEKQIKAEAAKYKLATLLTVLQKEVLDINPEELGWGAIGSMNSAAEDLVVAAYKLIDSEGIEEKLGDLANIVKY